MLPKINRLKKTKEIERVFKNGRGVRQGFLFLKLIKNNTEVNRFAFIVSQKVAKRAVQRNQIKRRLRGAILKKILRIKTGFDFVLVAQKGILGKNFQEIEKNIEIILGRANLFA